MDIMDIYGQNMDITKMDNNAPNTKKIKDNAPLIK